MLATPRGQFLSLYRTLLRTHERHLPANLRHLGDAYVKQEFRLHAKAPQLDGFLKEWNKYLEQLRRTVREKELAQIGSIQEKAKFGADLPEDVDLSEEQLQQLEKLRQEAHKAATSD